MFFMGKKYNSVEEMEQAKLKKANRPFYKKKRTYGLLAILLFIVVVISSCAAFFTGVDKAIEEATPKEVSLSDNKDSKEKSEKGKKEAVANKTLIVYNANGIKVSLDDVQRDEMFETTDLNFTVENNYGKNVEIFIENISIDGVTYDSGAMFEVRNGKTQKDSSILDDSDGGVPQFKKELEMEITIQNPDTFETIDKKVFVHDFK